MTPRFVPIAIPTPSRALVEAAFSLGVPREYGRKRDLRQIREPAQLLSIGLDTQGREQRLTPRAARAWARMRDAAALAGVELQIVSAFRSIEYQLRSSSASSIAVCRWTTSSRSTLHLDIASTIAAGRSMSRHRVTSRWKKNSNGPMHSRGCAKMHSYTISA